MTARHVQLNDWLLVLLPCTYVQVCLCCWEWFTRCMPEMRNPIHRLHCLLHLASSRRRPLVACSERHLGRLAVVTSHSSRQAYFANMAPIIPTLLNSTSHRIWSINLWRSQYFYLGRENKTTEKRRELMVNPSEWKLPQRYKGNWRKKIEECERKKL